jgi:23S rRNA (guanosine2251-2'-O)-methyltransferase
LQPGWTLSTQNFRLYAMYSIVLIVHNVRSTHNVGSILRSADGFGLEKVYFTGYTPYPSTKNDSRLPHISSKIDKQIHKTALGAENNVAWQHAEQIEDVINKLKKQDYLIVALEQTQKSKLLNEFKSAKKTAIIVGNEVDGLDKAALNLTDEYIEIPMAGSKESYNVAIAASIAMYHMKFNGQKT